MCQIKDCKTLLNAFTCNNWTSWEAKFHENFICLDVVSYHPLWCWNLEYICDIQKSKSFIVNWSTMFICFVISMRVLLLYLVKFSKIVSLNYVVNSLSLTPVDKVLEHKLDGSYIEFSCATEPQIIVIIILCHIDNFSSLNPFFELGQDFFLLWGNITYKTLFWYFFWFAVTEKSHLKLLIPSQSNAKN